MTDRLPLVDALADLQEATDPTVETGDKVNDVVVQPTNSAPLAGAISERSGTKWVKLWNTRTGEEVTVNIWNLAAALKKVHKDPAFPAFLGKSLFSKQPTVKRVLGTYKCLLHPDQTMRAEYNKYGLPTCLSAHFASEAEVNRHMQKKHKEEYKALQATKAEAERQEMLELQRQQIKVMTELAKSKK